MSGIIALQFSQVAVLDTIWGTLLFGLTGFVLQLIRPRLQRVIR